MPAKKKLTVPGGGGGRPPGMLFFYRANAGRRFVEDDLHVGEELAHRAALAIDNGRLHRAEQEAHTAQQVVADRLERLHGVAAALSQAVTVADALNAILTEGIAASGAKAGVVGLVGD